MTNVGLKYEFHVHPKGDPSLIAIRTSDSLQLIVESNKVSMYSMDYQGVPVFEDKGLKVFQDEESISAKFVEIEEDSTSYGIEVGEYDKSRDLIIDPWFMPFSSFLGGTYDDRAWSITVDDEDCIYSCGWTKSKNFPVKNALNSTATGGSSRYFAYITKLHSNGSLLYSTYFGGTYGMTCATDIAVGGSGDIYITGYVRSSSLPVKNAYNDTYSGADDAFIAKLNSTGNGIEFCSYLGGANNEIAWALSIDSNENVYLTGVTYSPDFPTENAYDDEYWNYAEAFVSSFTSTGAIRFSTFLGGHSSDTGTDIGTDAEGLIYVVGRTSSTSFPTSNAYDDSQDGLEDIFVTRFESDGQTLNYSTFIGKSQNDIAKGIHVFPNGSCIITGYSSSPDYPTLNAYNATHGGACDIILTMLNPAGDSLVFSTYIGGSSNDYGEDIAVGPSGCISVTGYSESDDYPLVNEYSSTRKGGYDAVLTKFTKAGDDVEFSTYIGSTGDEEAKSVAVDSEANIAITGWTDSSAYPTIREFQSAYGGNEEAFVTKFALDNQAPEIILTSPEDSSTVRPGNIIDLDITDNWFIENVEYNWDGIENFTLSSPYNITALSPPSDSDRILNVYVEDAAGNSVHESYTFMYSTLWTPFSTYMVGSGKEIGYDIKVDDEGYIYIVGETDSSDFNVTIDSYNETNNGGQDIFFCKLSPSGQLLYSSYFGGSNDDMALALDLDNLGNIVFTGRTKSTDFPTTQDAINHTHNGGTYDAFVVRFTITDGALLYSSYLGGSSGDTGFDICLDSSGYAYVTGDTSSDDLPTNSTAAQPSYGGGMSDAFVFKISVVSYDLAYCSYLGGDDLDGASAIDLGQLGRVIVTGRTHSINYPTQSPYQTDQPNPDAYVTWLTSTGGLLNSTYLGGSLYEWGLDVYADPTSDAAIIVGQTTSGDFPSINPLQSHGGDVDGFLTFMWDSDSVVFSSHIGGSGVDVVNGIDINLTSWDTYLVGITTSTDFPVKNALYNNLSGTPANWEIFVMALENIASTPLQMLYSTYIGGSFYDEGYGIALDNNDIYITGYSKSHDYPIYNAFEDEYNSEEDVIVTKLSIDEAPPEIGVENPTPGSVHNSGTIINLTILDDGIGVSHVLANWDGAENQSLTYPYQIALVSGDGPHILNLYSNDSIGNTADESYVFIADDSDPEIILDWPGNETLQKAGTIGDLDFVESNLNVVLHRWDSSDYTPLDSPYNFVFPFGDGMHTLEVVANDSAGNWDYAKYVFYNDDIFPDINLQYPVNNTAHHSNLIIEVDVYDLHLDEVLYHWDSASINTTWNEPYEVFLPTGDGVHRLHVYAMDVVENCEYTVFTFITDDTLPGLSHPSDIMMSEGDLGETISWTPTSPDPNDYTIYRNGTEIDTDIWLDEEPITLSLDDLPYGYYNFTIIIFDGSVNSAID
jgi:hypothetical protein